MREGAGLHPPGLPLLFYLKDMFDYTCEKWKRKRNKILKRDGYQCVRCRRYGKNVEAKIVHHIKEADLYPELAWTDSNLESVCMACHNKLHPEKATAAAKSRL